MRVKEVLEGKGRVSGPHPSIHKYHKQHFSYFDPAGGKCLGIKYERIASGGLRV